jgi:hypothetical protein
MGIAYSNDTFSFDEIDNAVKNYDAPWIREHAPHFPKDLWKQILVDGYVAKSTGKRKGLLLSLYDTWVREWTYKVRWAASAILLMEMMRKLARSEQIEMLQNATTKDERLAQRMLLMHTFMFHPPTLVDVTCDELKHGWYASGRFVSILRRGQCAPESLFDVISTQHMVTNDDIMLMTQGPEAPYMEMVLNHPLVQDEVAAGVFPIHLHSGMSFMDFHNLRLENLRQNMIANMVAAKILALEKMDWTAVRVVAKFDTPKVGDTSFESLVNHLFDLRPVSNSMFVLWMKDLFEHIKSPDMFKALRSRKEWSDEVISYAIGDFADWTGLIEEHDRFTCLLDAMKPEHVTNHFLKHVITKRPLIFITALIKSNVFNPTMLEIVDPSNDDENFTLTHMIVSMIIDNYSEEELYCIDIEACLDLVLSKARPAFLTCHNNLVLHCGEEEDIGYLIASHDNYPPSIEECEALDNKTRTRESATLRRRLAAMKSPPKRKRKRKTPQASDTKTCCICYEPTDEWYTSTSCGHSFCQNCINLMTDCAQCRTPIENRIRVHLCEVA